MKKIMSIILMLGLSISLISSCDGQENTSAKKDENKSATPKITAIEEMENYVNDAKQYRVTYEDGSKMAFRVLNNDHVMVCSNITPNKDYNPDFQPESLMSFNDYHGELSIPESVTINGKEYTVTTIERGAFWDTDITSVILPKTIITMDAGAFMHSFDEWPGFGTASAPLEKITVLDGNPRFDSRENCNAVIETASNTLIVGCKNTVIPEGIERIAAWAFCNCDIVSLTIPASVDEIGHRAFYSCYKLTSITIQNPFLRYDFEDIFYGGNPRVIQSSSY